MIPYKEAQQRIKLWSGFVHTRLITREDGVKFLETKLLYYDTSKRLDLSKIRTEKDMEHPYQLCIADTIIYPEK